MFDNVIVGVGEHESWHDAIALAKQLVSTDGRLTLTNIYVFGAEPRLSGGFVSQPPASAPARSSARKPWRGTAP